MASPPDVLDHVSSTGGGGGAATLEIWQPLGPPRGGDHTHDGNTTHRGPLSTSRGPTATPGATKAGVFSKMQQLGELRPLSGLAAMARVAVPLNQRDPEGTTGPRIGRGAGGFCDHEDAV